MTPADHIELHEISSGDTWDSLVDGSPQGTVFHRWDWQACVAKRRKGLLRFLGFYEADRLVAGCAITLLRKSGLLIGQSSPSSVTPVGGLLVSGGLTWSVRRLESRLAEIVELLTGYLKGEGSCHNLLNHHWSLVDMRPFTWRGWDARIRYTYLQDISDLALLWKNMNNDVRRSFKKYESRLSETSMGEAADLHNLLVQTYEHSGNKFGESFELMRDLHALVGKNDWGRLIVVREHGEAIAARYVLWDNKRSYYWLAASRPDNRNSGVDAFATWKAVEAAADRTVRMDWCGASTQSIARYKASFNGTLTPAYSTTWATPIGMAAARLYALVNKVRA